MFHVCIFYTFLFSVYNYATYKNIKREEIRVTLKAATLPFQNVQSDWSINIHVYREVVTKESIYSYID